MTLRAGVRHSQTDDCLYMAWLHSVTDHRGYRRSGWPGRQDVGGLDTMVGVEWGEAGGGSQARRGRKGLRTHGWGEQRVLMEERREWRR